MTVRLYCGINEHSWNGIPPAPGPYACIAPVYGSSERTRRKNGVSVPADCEIIQDSGAFSDSWGNRLNFAAALDRQLAHGEQYDYWQQVTHVASYDVLIDEVWTDGNRHKRRWSVEDAESAVNETVAAAEWLAAHRPDGKKLILSAQGVDAEQYLECARQIVGLIEPGDILGLGGWCITGKMPRRMMPTFRATIRRVIPFAALRGVERVHIWGVIYAPALGELAWLCDQHGIQLSTDSAGPSTRPAFGEWGYAEWKDRDYVRAPVERRGEERARHVALTREWLREFHRTAWYREPPAPAFQLSLF
jgi:hypothetical protein